MGRTNHIHGICQSLCAPHQPAPLPIFCPHQLHSKQRGRRGGVAVSFLLAEGMWDWIFASPRLCGFIRPELAVSRGAVD